MTHRLKLNSIIFLLLYTLCFSCNLNGNTSSVLKIDNSSESTPLIPIHECSQEHYNSIKTGNPKLFNILKHLDIKTDDTIENLEELNLIFTTNETERISSDKKNLLSHLEKLDKLDGIEHFENLETLRVIEHEIVSLAPLNGLKKLTRLNLSDNSISDLSPLQSLPQLSHLKLARNKFTSISALSSCVNLEHVELAGNPQGNNWNLADLNNLKNLKNLGLSDCSLSKIDLSGLPKLNSLLLFGNPITNLEELFKTGKFRSIGFTITDFNKNLIKDENSAFDQLFEDKEIITVRVEAVPGIEALNTEALRKFNYKRVNNLHVFERAQTDLK